MVVARVVQTRAARGGWLEFRVVDKTDGRNLLAIIREIDANPEQS
jgi:hypothetical protein